MERRTPTPTLDIPDLRERGAPKNGQPQTSDRRLFMQFLAFGGCTESSLLLQALMSMRIIGVLYEDLHDPLGVGLLTLSDDPDDFLSRVRPMLGSGPFARLTLKPEYSMFGRTYALGYEPDLQESLFDRPQRTALNPAWPWAIWYPLRRSGRFAQLPADEQRAILSEHGAIGRAFGEGDYAHDIRLACHGLDARDNDFVIGLVGRELYPLSAIVQAMRKTQQTSLYLDRLGPFFVGRAVWRSEAEES